MLNEYSLGTRFILFRAALIYRVSWVGYPISFLLNLSSEVWDLFATLISRDAALLSWKLTSDVGGHDRFTNFILKVIFYFNFDLMSLWIGASGQNGHEAFSLKFQFFENLVPIPQKWFTKNPIHQKLTIARHFIIRRWALYLSDPYIMVRHFIFRRWVISVNWYHGVGINMIFEEIGFWWN